MSDEARRAVPEDLQRMLSEIEAAGGQVWLDERREVGSTNGGASRWGATVRTGARHMTGTGETAALAVYDVLLRLAKTPWTIAGLAREADGTKDRHEWTWSVESADSSEAKQIVVYLSKSLVARTGDLAETPGGEQCLLTKGRSTVESYLEWRESPDVIVMQSGQLGRTEGGIR